jgi:hypothetical protein
LPPLWYKWFTLDYYEAKGVAISSSGTYAVTICEKASLEQIMIGVQMSNGAIALLSDSIPYTSNLQDVLTSSLLIRENPHIKIIASLYYYQNNAANGIQTLAIDSVGSLSWLIRSTINSAS